MRMSISVVLLVLSITVRAYSQNHGIPVAAAKSIGSVYLVPVFVPNNQDHALTDGTVNNRVESNYYGETSSPLRQIVLGYSSAERSRNQKNNYDHILNNMETSLARQKRSPGGGYGGGGGGGRGHGGGRSGSWSRSSASSSSGSWGGGHGGGKGFGGGKGGGGYGK